MLNLSSLSMENNLFTGHLPLAFGRLHLLQLLLSYENGFFGEVPSSPSYVTELSILELGGS